MCRIGRGEMGGLGGLGGLGDGGKWCCWLLVAIFDPQAARGTAGSAHPLSMTGASP